MISEWLRGRTRGIVEILALQLERTGISPNALTLVGFAIMLVIGVVLARGQFVAGALLILFGGAFDALDGGLARLTGRVTPFGAFLDSTTDRWAEAAIYGGLIYHFSTTGATTELVLAYVAIIGSLLVSYTRARAEGLGLECKVGLFTRFERIVVLVIGLLTGWMLPALALLALLSNVTAVQRILHVYRQAG